MQAQGVRLEWQDVAEHIREEVARVLGSPVVTAVNEPGGFSPGVAARAVLADGRRCFIKAVSSAPNPMTPFMHRREAHVTAALPEGLPVPNLIATVDDGNWAVLVFEEIDGTPPSQPWRMEDLGATFAAIDEFVRATTPCPVPGLLAFAEQHAENFRCHRRLAAGDPTVDRLDEWTRRHLDLLAALEDGWERAAAGDSLLHSDLRADNLLVRADGSVVIVDWPHGCTGAGWIDKACMLPSVALGGGPTPTEVERVLDPLAGADRSAVDQVVVGLAGYFTYQGAQPDPPGLPTVRAFQRAQGEVARAWLAERLRLP